MGTPGRIPTLALLAVLAAAAPGHAQEGVLEVLPAQEEVCPHREEWRPEDLQAMLRAHQERLNKGSDPAVPGRAILCNADLSSAQLQAARLERADLRAAQLQGADLNGADLQDANLGGADLRGAYLIGADLQGANLRRAQLDRTNLTDADLSRADLRGAELRFADLRATNLEDAKLSGVALFGALYEAGTSLARGHLGGLRGLTTVQFTPGQSSGLVQLRAQLREAGLRDLERRATYAIEHNITRDTLARRWEDPSAAFLALLRLIFTGIRQSDTHSD